MYVPIVSLIDDLVRRSNELARQLNFEGEFAIGTRAADEDAEADNSMEEEGESGDHGVPVELMDTSTAEQPLVVQELDSWATQSFGRCGRCVTCLPLRFGPKGKGRPGKCAQMCAPANQLSQHGLSPCDGCARGATCTLKGAVGSPATGTSTRLRSRLPPSPTAPDAPPLATPRVTREDLQRLPEDSVPKKIMRVAEVPVLGTGKTDYVRIQQMAELEKAA